MPERDPSEDSPGFLPANLVVRAADAAIRAAAQVTGGCGTPGELVGGIVAVVRTNLGPADADALAQTMLVDVVLLVGERRVLEILDEIQTRGARSGFS